MTSSHESMAAEPAARSDAPINLPLTRGPQARVPAARTLSHDGPDARDATSDSAASHVSFS